MSYLFLAIPNFCGSTLVHNLIDTCPNVVSLTDPNPIKNDGTDDWRKEFVEGNCVAPMGYQNLLGPHSMEANMEHVYANPNNYNWKYIKKVWNKNWATKNELATIRLQKTPADIFRIPMMVPYFPNTKWIISVRNPYAYIESIIRKATFHMEPIRQLDQICFHVLRVMELQIQNAQFLGENAYAMTYEDFCARPEQHKENLGNWIPELKQINFDKELWIKGNKSNKIIDDTEKRIQNLIDGVPDILNMINKYFIPLEPLLNQWGYEIRYK